MEVSLARHRGVLPTQAAISPPLCSLAVLARPEAVLLLAPPGRRGRWRRAAVFAGCAAARGPWVAFNFATGGALARQPARSKAACQIL
jgi:hypothetical protein